MGAFCVFLLLCPLLFKELKLFCKRSSHTNVVLRLGAAGEEVTGKKVIRCQVSYM